MREDDKFSDLMQYLHTGGALLAATHGARGAPGRGERRAHAAVPDAAGRRLGGSKVRSHAVKYYQSALESLFLSPHTNAF